LEKTGGKGDINEGRPPAEEEASKKTHLTKVLALATSFQKKGEITDMKKKKSQDEKKKTSAGTRKKKSILISL